MPPDGRARVAVLASGGGSNLQAIVDHLARLADPRPAGVDLVVSTRPGARALERARGHGIASVVVAADDEGALERALDEARIDLVVLAGHLRLVPERVTERYRGRMLNVHPALLPAFGGQGLYGARVHRAVLDSGAQVSGATVHFVDAHYDRGPIAAQWPVPVLDGDTPESLAARVLRVEHLLLPRVVEAVARGRLTVDDCGRVRGGRFSAPLSAFAPGDVGDAELARQIDALFSHS